MDKGNKMKKLILATLLSLSFISTSAWAKLKDSAPSKDKASLSQVFSAKDLKKIILAGSSHGHSMPVHDMSGEEKPSDALKELLNIAGSSHGHLGQPEGRTDEDFLDGSNMAMAKDVLKELGEFIFLKQAGKTFKNEEACIGEILSPRESASNGSACEVVAEL